MLASGNNSNNMWSCASANLQHQCWTAACRRWSRPRWEPASGLCHPQPTSRLTGSPGWKGSVAPPASLRFLPGCCSWLCTTSGLGKGREQSGSSVEQRTLQRGRYTDATFRGKVFKCCALKPQWISYSFHTDLWWWHGHYPFQSVGNVDSLETTASATTG